MKATIISDKNNSTILYENGDFKKVSNLELLNEVKREKLEVDLFEPSVFYNKDRYTFSIERKNGFNKIDDEAENVLKSNNESMSFYDSIGVEFKYYKKTKWGYTENDLTEDK